MTSAKIAQRLNEEGFRTPSSRSAGFNRNAVNKLLARQRPHRSLIKRETLAAHEWWLPELAAKLGVSTSRLYHWQRKGYLHAKKKPQSKFWILWADDDELERLRRLRDYLATEHRIPYPAELTQPKPRNA